MPAFIETQFPIARLSAESYKERKAAVSQTLPTLGKWWGRKPLVLVRAIIVGMLMPSSDDPKKDRDVFLKILTMDDDGVWDRCLGDVPAGIWRDFADTEIATNFFTARGFRSGLSQAEKDQICATILSTLSAERRRDLDQHRRRAIADRTEFDRLAYSARIRYCERPENHPGPTPSAWEEINAHLGTHASTLSDLIQELGKRMFDDVPRVGDCFSGGGSIPFEAARMGCRSYGSDLNPVAALLTWSDLNILGRGE
ncbi:MAG TPA: DUF1156 domain-containing protein, partial [Lacipirellulaceae bacterium]|nr:DUF1156 domain-containing protein [Lacipirellulaceae bacterium]